MSTNNEAEEILTYLESNDSEVVKQFKNIVQENLYSSHDHNLLDTLVDQYVHTRSDRLIELLVGVSEAHSIHLFEKLNEHLKQGAHLAVCTLLFSIVRKQPSWLHKIVGTHFFSNFLKILKTGNNFILIMNGIIILSTLMPCVPAILAPYHGEILEVFVHSACLLLNKFGNIPEVCTLHLHVGVYIFFHRLYSMYPNNFLSYMRSHFSGRKSLVFQQVIKPMLEFVKFHPGLITDTSKSEASLEKWKIFQPNDILAECQKLSLDPLDSIKEASYVGYFETIEAHHPHNHHLHQQHQQHQQQQQQQQQHTTKTESNALFLNLNTVFANPDGLSTHAKERKDQQKTLTAEKPSKLNEHFPVCNPSDIIGNQTPPSSRPISPSSSAHDISIASSKHPHSEHCEASNDHLNESAQTLNDSGIDRKLSGDSMSTSSTSRLLTFHNRTNSVDNVHQKSGMLKSLLSSNHSTPLDKDTSRKSTPTSPRKTSATKGLKNRPISTEFLKSKLSFGHSGQHDVQSAPTSPMVHASHANSSSNLFSFNVPTDIDPSDLPTEDIKELLISCSKISSHSLATDAHVNLEKDSKSLNIISDLKDMFCEVLASARDPNEPPSETIDELTNISAYVHQYQQHAKSPFNLLDDFIQYGCTLNSSILRRIPLTSQLDTDWNYFGNSTSADDQKILQMQVHMLHLQLLYERYKSKLHCLRNRRLFGKLQNTHSVQNEVDSLKDRLSLTESKLKEVKFTLKLKTEKNRKIKACHTRKEKELNARICELEENNRALQYKLRSCEGKKRVQQEQNKTLQKELHKVKNLLFEATQEILNSQPKIKDIENLSTVIDVLQKELFTQAQKQERMKNTVENFQVKNNKEMQMEAKLRAHCYELEELKDQNEVLRSQVEELKIKLYEMESTGVKKEKIIRHQKEQFSRNREKHKKELQVCNDRFESCKKTCQSLQSYITSLRSKVDGAEHRRHSNLHRKSETLAGLDIPNMPPQHSSHDQSHRHSLNTLTKPSDNPFTNKSRTSSASDTTQ